jgi:hypothetical protein
LDVLAACLYNELLKFADDLGRVFYRGELAADIACTYGATVGDRRLLPGLLEELHAARALLPGDGFVQIANYHAHKPRKKRLSVDGTDLTHESFRKLYCVEQGSFATLSLLARGMLGELLRLCEDDGRMAYAGHLGSFVATRLKCQDRNDRRTVIKLVEELERDGSFLRQGDGKWQWIWFRNFAKANPQGQAFDEEDEKVVYLPRRTDLPVASAAGADDHESATSEPPVDHEKPRKYAELHGVADGETSGSRPAMAGQPVLFPDLGEDEQEDNPGWFARMWTPWPATNGRKPKRKDALKKARQKCREKRWTGDQLADRVLAALDWLKNTTDYKQGKAPYLSTFLHQEMWTEEKPTDPLAFADPDVPPWERRKVAKATVTRRRADESSQRDLEASRRKAPEVPREQQIEQTALEATDWRKQESWKRRYLSNLDPVAQKIWDGVIRQRLREMHAGGYTTVDKLPLWAQQFVEKHPRKPRLPAPPSPAEAPPPGGLDPTRPPEPGALLAALGARMAMPDGAAPPRQAPRLRIVETQPKVSAS